MARGMAYVAMHNPASGQWEIARVGGGRVGAPYPHDQAATRLQAHMLTLAEANAASGSNPEHFGARPELGERFDSLGS